MRYRILLALVVGFLTVAAPAADTDWDARADAALEAVKADRSIESVRAVLDACRRSDRWLDAAKLAGSIAGDTEFAEPLVPERFMTAWRAGEFRTAKQLYADHAERIDREAPAYAIQWLAAVGELDAANKLGRRVMNDKAAPPFARATAASVVLLSGESIAGVADALSDAVAHFDPDAGYPENIAADALDGVADFVRQIGTEPVNQVVRWGEAPMPRMAMINLPGALVMINGRGPLRCIFDTGGSVTLALDHTAADRVGLTSLADAKVFGAGGEQPGGQAIADRVTFGDVECRRVLVRTLDLHGQMGGVIDGIIGTGIFGGARLEMDFVDGRFAVSPSSETAGPGELQDAYIVGDAKILLNVDVNNQSVLALLDSGADAVAISPAFAERCLESEAALVVNTGVMGVGSDHQSSVALLPAVHLAVGKKEFPSQGVVGLGVMDDLLSPIIGVEMPLLCGMPLIRQMDRLTIDYPTARIWVDWTAED